MRYLPTGEQMKDADRYTIEHIGIPSMVLMERAALGVVQYMEENQFDLSRILVVCGSGNNGGDGYAVARLLWIKGYAVEILFVGKEASRSEENRKQKEIAAYYKIPMLTELQSKDYRIVVDALFGTGLSREITGSYAEVINQLNDLPCKKLAIDIPSGIHDTTGKVMGTAFCADDTVAIAYAKLGVIFAQEYAGNVCVKEIGVTDDSLTKDLSVSYCYEREDLRMRYPKRQPNSHKGSHGKVLLIVGSHGMSGAAYLSARVAYEVGAGLVQIYTAESNREILQRLLPEAIITTYEQYEEETLEQLLAWADVVSIGSGLGKSDVAVSCVEHTLRTFKGICVVDADAINILAEHREWLHTEAELIFTPHMKEMSRLIGMSVADIKNDRLRILNEWKQAYSYVCVLKDARTVVAQNGQACYVNCSGNAAMAKAGSGDVLAGMITGIAAQNTKAYEAATLGVYLHGLAGDAARDKKGSYSVLADDIIDGISMVLKKL